MRSSWLYLRPCGVSDVMGLGRVGALGQALPPARSSRLDLAGAKPDHEVGDESVFRLAAAVADHGAPSSGEGKQSGFDTFGYRAYLIHLEEQRVARFPLDASLDASRVGDEQIVAHLQQSSRVSHVLSRTNSSG